MGNIVTKQPKKYMTAGTAVIAQPMTGTASTAVIAQPMTGVGVVGKKMERFTVYDNDYKFSSKNINFLLLLALVIVIGYAYYKLK
jgi:hypothetical protein